MRAAAAEPRFAGLTAVVLRSVLLVVVFYGGWLGMRFLPRFDRDFDPEVRIEALDSALRRPVSEPVRWARDALVGGWGQAAADSPFALLFALVLGTALAVRGGATIRRGFGLAVVAAAGFAGGILGLAWLEVDPGPAAGSVLRLAESVVTVVALAYAPVWILSPLRSGSAAPPRRLALLLWVVLVYQVDLLVFSPTAGFRPSGAVHRPGPDLWWMLDAWEATEWPRLAGALLGLPLLPLLAVRGDTLPGAGKALLRGTRRRPLLAIGACVVPFAFGAAGSGFMSLAFWSFLLQRNVLEFAGMILVFTMAAGVLFGLFAYLAARFSLALATDSTEPPGAEPAPKEAMGSASGT